MTESLAPEALRTKSESNLTPELHELVRSDEFKAWFGDWQSDPDEASKIVDENGEPALVYFGGPSGITKLHGGKRNRTGPDEKGFYFTTQRRIARFYATALHDPITDDPIPGTIYSAFLNIRNPYEKQKGDNVRTQRITEVPEGYDGCTNETANEIVAFSPDQVRFVGKTPIDTAPYAPLNGTVDMH